jgi:hypothetical protein|tara:strand:+ start:659 stop:937 length:279 start_codon:yes stop_codon:yes gene_type:complete
MRTIEQILSKQVDYLFEILLEIKDFKETNKQLDSALVKGYDDLKSLKAQLDAQELQLNTPTQEDLDNFEIQFLQKKKIIDRLIKENKELKNK